MSLVDLVMGVQCEMVDDNGDYRAGVRVRWAESNEGST
jgi:hypothetical protein